MADDAGEALYQLSRQGKTEEVKELLERKPEGGLKKINPDEYMGYDGSTALVMAAKNGHTGCCDILIEHGADLSVKTDDLSNLLHMAIRQPDVCRFIMEKHPETGRKLVNEVNDDTFTPLHLATYYAEVETVRVFCELGVADVYITCEDGNILDLIPATAPPGLRAYLESKAVDHSKFHPPESADAGSSKVNEKFGYDCFDGEVHPSA